VVRSNIWTQVGRRIRAIRAERELSQDQLAEKALLSISLVSKLEAGHKGAKLESLIKLADALDVTLAELLPYPIGDSAPPKTTIPAQRSQIRYAIAQSRASRVAESPMTSREQLSVEQQRLIERTRSLSKADLRILSYLAQLMGEAQQR
jgi:HTH-type transcriptional regulator, competence development regulator